MTDNKLPIAQADTLKDLAPIAHAVTLQQLHERLGEVVCFTPAILVVVGKLPVDPVREFITRFPSDSKDATPFCIDLPAGHPPFFRGLGVTVTEDARVDWDRRLYGIAKAWAGPCFAFMGGIGIHGDGQFASSAQHAIQLPDPTSLFVRRLIPVEVFALLRGDSIFYLESHPTAQPYLARTDSAPYIGNRFQLNPDRDAIRKTLEDTL